MIPHNVRSVVCSTFLASLLALSPGLVYCEPPEQGGITAPDAVEAGTLVVASADKEGTWIVLPESWQDSVRVDSNDKTLYFASPVEGTVYIVHSAPSEGGGLPIVSTHVLINGGESPGPGPGPLPPGPSPSDLVALVRAEAAKVGRPTEAAQRAYIFEQLAERIDDGEFEDAVEVREAANLIVETSFNAESDAAWSDYQKTLAVEFERRYEAGGLRVPSDYAEIFRDIAAGLRSAVQSKPEATPQAQPLQYSNRRSTRR